MKKQLLLGIILVFINTCNYAQSSQKDSINSSKNELGTNLIPFFKLSTTTSFNIKRLNPSIYYKRQIHPNLYYRLGVSLYNTNHYSKQEKFSFPETHVNSGLEYRWGKRNIKYFTGADLGYSYLKSTSTYLGTSDTINNSYNTVRQGITITPFIGMQYHFSKKFFFSMQLGPEVGYVFGSRKQIISNTPNYLPLKFKEYSVTGGVLGNFSLFYKF